MMEKLAGHQELRPGLSLGTLGLLGLCDNARVVVYYAHFTTLTSLPAGATRFMQLALNTTNVTTQALGQAQGLDLPALLNTHREAVHNAVTTLQVARNQEGQWSKWLNSGHDTDMAYAVMAYAQAQKEAIDDVVVLGIGGSSLGGIALTKALLHPQWNLLSCEQRQGWPRIHFVDNVDADVIASLMDVLDMRRTLVNVISKSGTTAETMAAFMLFKAKLNDTFAGDAQQIGQRLVFTTDPAKGILRQLANELNVTCFEVPDDVGGRFSVFSAVGMLPAALVGLDVHAFQQGLNDAESTFLNPNVDENPAALNAVIQLAYYRQGKPLSVLMPYSTRLAFVADWYVQLWAESLGKAVNKTGQRVNEGPTPLKAVGATDQHSQIQLYNEGPNDKVVTFIQVQKPDNNTIIPNALPNVDALGYLANQSFHTLLTAEFEATRASLTRNQRPNVTLTLPSITPYSFAQLLLMFEVQTAIAGHLLNIDPFDQPGVELAKQYTYALMGRKGFEHLIAEAKGEAPLAV